MSQRVLLLSSSLLTDRMLVHSTLLPRLTEACEVEIWATSARNDDFREMWSRVPAQVRPFPDVPPIRERINLVRRVNDGVWDRRLRPPSRLSMDTHVRIAQEKPLVRSMRLPARVLATARMERRSENLVERLVVRTAGNADLEQQLERLRPALVVVMNPFWFRYEPPVAAMARRMGIPIAAFVPSWDNISTKSRPTLRYDAYYLWSDQARRELHHFYPQVADRPVHVVGAPQFDVFFDHRFEEPRADFCRRHHLEPERPIVTYAVGSPNFLQEHHGAKAFAARVAAGDLGDVQLLVRPHPIHDRDELSRQIDTDSPRVVVQRVAAPEVTLNERSQDDADILDWVSTFRHSDVVVNLSSTVTVDAAIFDHPVVNLDFDPEPGAPKQQLVRDVNHSWTHFKPVAESGGVWLASTMDDVVEGVRAYLRDPGLHREERRWIVRHVCDTVDGRAGERLAAAIASTASVGAAVDPSHVR